MKLAVAILAFALGGASFSASAPGNSAITDPPEHATSVQLVFTDGGRCTGTIIGPHALLSATHCFAEAPLATVNGVSVKVTKSLSDGSDHTMVWLDRTYTAWASPGAPKLIQGMNLHWWGNPLGRHDLLRRGYVTGFEPPNWALIDATVGDGDSGSGIFNDAGELVAVVSTVYAPREYFHLMGTMMLAFTPEQWAQARA